MHPPPPPLIIWSVTMLGFLGHTDHIITTAQGAGVPADGKKVFRNFCLEPTAPHTHMPRLLRPGPILYGGEPSEDFLAPVSHGSEHTRGCSRPGHRPRRRAVLCRRSDSLPTLGPRLRGLRPKHFQPTNRRNLPT